MADNTTVQTTPAPRQALEEQIRCPYVITTSLASAGIEVALIPSEREVPEHWNDVRFLQAFHADGSACTGECGCVPKEERTTVRRGSTITIGEWTWFGGAASWLTGYRQLGPSDTERVQAERIEILREDLDHEAGLHHITKEDLNHNIRNVKFLVGRRTALVRRAARYRYERMRLRSQLSMALAVAGAGWGAALALALVLIGGVIG